MYLYGASGHAKVIIDILELLRIPVDGLYDDNPEIKQLLSYPVLGSLKNQVKRPQLPFIISIGNNLVRKKIKELFPLVFANALIHPEATISNRAVLGEGTVVMGHAIINADTRIGQHAIINTSASIDHDCTIGDFVHISPNATLTGGVTVGEGTMVGAGAVIIPYTKIGQWAVIGAGSVVTKNIPDYELWMGNPARFVRKLNRCD